MPDVVKEESFDDALPIYGGHGAGAVTAGALGPDRQPSRRQLGAAAMEEGVDKGDKEAVKAIKDTKVASDTAASAELRSSNLAKKAAQGSAQPPATTTGKDSADKKEL